MATAVVFLDVDGVMHPLGANYLPLHATHASLVDRAEPAYRCGRRHDDDTDT